MELGIPGQPDHPKVVDAYERTAAACRAHGKHMGMGGVYEPELMRGYVEIGARLVLAGSDMSFLMAGAKAQAAATRSMLS